MPRSKLLNAPDEAVKDMLEGFVAAHAHIALLDKLPADIKVLLHTGHDRSRVAVISGGGSGHEPAHGGYIGAGMLSAVVAGDIFASPSSSAVYDAIRAVGGPAGVLLVVKNYTGDRLNFGMAAERAKCDGLQVEMVIVNDDVGVVVEGAAGQRGIAGTVFVHKIAGATAAAGSDLQAVTHAAEAAAAAIASMGAALSTCTVPGSGDGDASHSLPDGQVELGLGIHGEPGAQRVPLMTSKELVTKVFDTVFASERRPSGRVVLMVNNLGSTTAMELYVTAREALVRLTESGCTVERLYVGTYMTALDMAGVSFSIMAVDDATLKLLDAPTNAPAWVPVTTPPAADKRKVASEVEADAFDIAAAAGGDMRREGSTGEQRVRGIISACARACAAAEPELTKYDSVAGDGDCGYTLKRGAEALIDNLPGVSFADLGHAARHMASVVGRNMGGTSGAMYQVLFTAAASELAGRSVEDVTLRDWAAALAAGVQAIRKYGGAEVGDRTMLDALSPAADAAMRHAEGGACWAASEAAEAAHKGSAAVAQQVARAGRASYVDPALVKTVPDPGAHACTIWLRALADELASTG